MEAENDICEGTFISVAGELWRVYSTVLIKTECDCEASDGTQHVLPNYINVLSRLAVVPTGEDAIVFSQHILFKCFGYKILNHISFTFKAFS